ncbi:MAG: hypothetical protein ACLFR1_14260 [Spirochaetia bacterium]
MLIVFIILGFLSIITGITLIISVFGFSAGIATIIQGFVFFGLAVILKKTKRIVALLEAQKSQD